MVKAESAVVAQCESVFLAFGFVVSDGVASLPPGTTQEFSFQTCFLKRFAVVVVSSGAMAQLPDWASMVAELDDLLTVPAPAAAHVSAHVSVSPVAHADAHAPMQWQA